MDCKMVQETFKFWDLVHLILEFWWYLCCCWQVCEWIMLQINWFHWNTQWMIIAQFPIKNLSLNKMASIFQKAFSYVFSWTKMLKLETNFYSMCYCNPIDMSALVQIMAWCHQETSHDRNQYWPRSKMFQGHNELRLVMWCLVTWTFSPLFCVWFRHGLPCPK